MKTLKVKLYPTPPQDSLMRSWLGATRFLYNSCLAHQADIWRTRGGESTAFVSHKGEVKKTKGRFSQYDLRDQLCALRKEFPEEFAHVPRSVIEQTAFQLDQSFKNFFASLKRGAKKKSKRRRKDGMPSGYPRFARFSDWNSVAIEGLRAKRAGYLTFPKPLDKDLEVRALATWIGEVKFRGQELPDKADIGRTRLVLEPDGWYACMPIKEDNPTVWRPGSGACGIDLNIGDITVYDGATVYHVDPPPVIDEIEREIKRLQRMVSRSYERNGNTRSANCKEVLRRKALLQARLKRARKAFHQELSTEIVRTYDEVYVEDIRPANMVQNPKLAKAISRQCWGGFRLLLKDKCARHGRLFSEVNAAYTSKDCSLCGWRKEDLTLRDRAWVCGGCGAMHDRDANAAANVRARGMAKRDASEVQRGEVVARSIIISDFPPNRLLVSDEFANFES